MIYKDMINDVVNKYYDRVAVVCKKKAGITYKDLDRTSNAIIAFLYDSGLKKGDKIALFLGNYHHYREMFWVAGKGGFVLIPLDGRLKPKEVLYIINNSEAKCLVVSKEFESALDEIKGDLEFTRVFCTIDPDMYDYIYLDDLIKVYPTDNPNVSLAEDDLVWIKYTSSKRDLAKGAMFTQGAAGAMAEINVKFFMNSGNFNENIRALQVVPSYSFMGIIWDIAYQKCGALTVIIDGSNLSDIISFIEIYKIAHCYIPSSMLKLIVNIPHLNKYDLSSLKNITYGPLAMLARDLIKGIEKFGPIFTQAYCTLETGVLRIL